MKPEKREKRDTNPVCPGIWRETLKNLKNEKYIFQDVYYGEIHSKTWKMGKGHSRTWSIARKLKIIENEKHKL